MYKIWQRLGWLKTFDSDTMEKTWLAKNARIRGIQNLNYYITQLFTSHKCYQIIDCYIAWDHKDEYDE